jgi:ketosteroid isomerase-like protein
MTGPAHDAPMSTTASTTDTLAATIRTAFSQRDAAALAGLYTDDADIEIVDAVHPPDSPQRLHGRDAIRAHLDDVFSRDMTHEIDILAISGDALGYSLRCTYADGTRVVCSATAELAGGRIAREVGVQAWG